MRVQGCHEVLLRQGRCAGECIPHGCSQLGPFSPYRQIRSHSKNSSPGLFRKHVEKVLDSVDHKADEHKVVILKSWNEWAEGNYMEPDLKHGRGYLEALKEALNKKQ